MNFRDIKIVKEPRDIKDELFFKDFTNPIDLARLNQVGIDEGIKVHLLSQDWDFLKQTTSFS